MYECNVKKNHGRGDEDTVTEEVTMGWGFDNYSGE
jgi:hypothetical protein